jgi:hypothetical protein
MRKHTISLLFALMFLGTSASAQGHPQVVIGEGLVCDTPEEVHQYIVSGQNEEALKAINDEKQMNACVIIEVGFYIGEQTAAVRNEQGEWRITKILVVGVMTEKGFHATKPAVQYTAFLTKEEGADVSAPTFSLVTWKPEYAQNSREVQNWYKSQEMTPATRERLGVAWKSCCEHGDVVRTQFRVEYQGGAFLDKWFYLKNGVWTKIPDDIIHWGEHAPDKRATLFIYQSTGQELCFYPPEEGI